MLPLIIRTTQKFKVEILTSKNLSFYLAFLVAFSRSAVGNYADGIENTPSASYFNQSI